MKAVSFRKILNRPGVKGRFLFAGDAASAQVTKQREEVKRFLTSIVGLLAVSAVCASSAGAAVWYVATTGKDYNPGTFEKPWATFRKAAESLKAGDTVYVRGGTYYEKRTVIPANSGNAINGYITFQNFREEKVTLDGTVAVRHNPETRVFDLSGKAYVRIIGFRMLNYIYGINSDSPRGVPAAHHLEIRHCYINVGDPEYQRPKGRGCGIYIRNAHDFILADLEVYDCSSGISIKGSPAGESYNGQVLDVYSHDHWGNEGDGIYVGERAHDILISGCRVHGTHDDGIDVRGYNLVLKNCVAHDNTYARNDAHGFKLYGIDPANGANPGTNIRVERCVSYNNSRGMFLSGLGILNSTARSRRESHHAKRIEVVNCTVVNNAYGIVMENEYDRYPLKPVIYNTIGKSRARSALFYLQHTPALTADFNLWWTEENTRKPIDRAGRYYSSDQIENPRIPGSWFSDTGNDEHSRSVDPLFIDEANNDFRLRDDSPGIDAGLDVGLPYSGPSPDMGAQEAGVVEVISPSDYLKAGENWISIPVAAVNQEAYSVFADLKYWPNCVYHNLYRYHADKEGFVRYPGYQSDVPEFGGIIPGGAYKLMLAATAAPIRVTGIELVRDQALAIPGSRIRDFYFGNPFNKAVGWEGCQIVYRNKTLPVAEAVTQGWIGNVQHFNPASQSWETMRDTLEPWHAYRLQALTPEGLALVVPGQAIPRPAVRQAVQ